MATDVNQQGHLLGDDFILAPAMTIRAMRDSRYRHPANAIAELIDNSIDAEAPQVELLVREAEIQVNAQKRNRIYQLAVLDNGVGMSPDTLTQALRFGGRIPTRSINKIGKYGMGLPTASASQCKRVDVWSWQEGVANSYHAYISIDEVQANRQFKIVPVKERIPKEWLQLAQQRIGASGTLVVWSEIDRINVRSETVFRHLEEEIGRIYRRYIDNGSVSIRMAAFREHQTIPYEDKAVKPNDPLYLMTPSSTPGGWDTQPMFNFFRQEDLPVTVEGKQQTVQIIYSIVKPEALGFKGSYPGNTDYGRHALRNMGVSIVREDREILLETSLLDTTRGGGSRPENRWWGCEVRFNEGCDDLFGIDHNKQMAAHLSRALKEISQSNTGDTQLRDDLDGEESTIYDIAENIRRTTRHMMDDLELRFKQRPSPILEDDTDAKDEAEIAEALATRLTEEDLRSQGAEKTPSDLRFEQATEEEKIESLTGDLAELGYTEEDAKRQAQQTVSKKYRYKFANADLSGYSVFEVATSQSGVLIVKLNINHPAYEYLQFLESQTGLENNAQDSRPASALRLMILALARMQDDIQEPRIRMDFQDTCQRWGRILSRLMDEGVINASE